MSDHLKPGQRIELGRFLFSTNSRVALRLRRDGNLVLRQAGVKKPLWCSGTANQGVTHGQMEHDGNFVLYKPPSNWHTHTNGNPGAKLFVIDSGLVVILSSDGTPLWYQP
jgi:hypothetical protein